VAILVGGRAARAQQALLDELGILLSDDLQALGTQLADLR
jgi:hypothetical protein